MDSFIIKGGNPLRGDININGSKNAALPIMAASLLADKLTINNIPKLSDIYRMTKLLEKLGSVITAIDHEDQLTIEIDNSNIFNFTASYRTAREMRASIWILAPLLSRFFRAKVPLPGGCAIGARPVDLHIEILKAMGADVHIEGSYIHAAIEGRLKAVNFVFKKISVGATVSAIMSGVLAEGETILSNCAREPEIVDLCNCLNKMGAVINGVATSEIKIIGVIRLKNVSYSIMPDRIEGVTYMIAAAITKGNLNIYGIDNSIVDDVAPKLTQVGVQILPIENGLRVSCTGELNSVDICTKPYPGFATDLQAQFMSLMTICRGSSKITENIFENRFMHVSELRKMGADIRIDGNIATVKGVTRLTGAEVMASDLRAAASLVLAALATDGMTKIDRIYHIDRGYQALEKKLANCGADIVRIKNNHT